MHKPKVMLVIMDGWGYSPVHKGNAIWSAKTPTFDYLWSHYSHTLLNAFGESVGLPWGAIGSSEVGHTSMGCGKLNNQELSLIDKQIISGEFFRNKVLSQFLNDTKKSGKSIHLIGLVSDGGVHSHLTHLYALLKFIKKAGIKNNIFIHAITDGRDTAPKSAPLYLDELRKKIKKIGVNACIATISGRYFAMDRDSRWERTKEAYDIFTKDNGKSILSVEEVIDKSYKAGETDEFIKPAALKPEPVNKSFFKNILEKKVAPTRPSHVEPNDSVLFFNIRPDRMRQIAEMFLFPKKEIGTLPVKNCKILSLSTYNEFFPVKVAYPSEKVSFPIARVLSEHGYKQGHFAETEKYAHVTYFFNGGNSVPFKNEHWEMVSSPDVATYDLKPEMSASEITKKVLAITEKEKLDFVLINYANCDMVGHTGNFKKVVTAAETIDEQLKVLTRYLPETTLIITADHGNAECMIHPETGEIDKMHSVNPVPFIIVNEKFKRKNNTEVIAPAGILADVAPTILELFDLKASEDMNGISLLSTLK